MDRYFTGPEFKLRAGEETIFQNYNFIHVINKNMDSPCLVNQIS